MPVQGSNGNVEESHPNGHQRQEGSMEHIGRQSAETASGQDFLDSNDNQEESNTLTNPVNLRQHLLDYLMRILPERGAHPTSPTTLVMGIQHATRPTTYTALTCAVTSEPTVDELVAIALTDIQSNRVSHELLTSFHGGINYEVMRAGEARAIEHLNHWEDGCQILDTLASVFNRVLDLEGEKGAPVREAVAAETRTGLAVTWGFSPENPLYILYLIPLTNSFTQSTLPLPPLATMTMHSGPPTSDLPPGPSTSVPDDPQIWLARRFSALQPLMDTLMAPNSLLGEPYRSELQVQLALHISHELNHSLASKTGPNSFTQIVNGPRISTTDIKKFVTKLRPATFDNKRSHLNKIRHLHQWLQAEADEGREYGADNQVVKFLQLGDEFFKETSETIAMLTPQELRSTDDRQLQRSARFKPWRFWENLCNVVEDVTRRKSSEDEMLDFATS